MEIILTLKPTSDPTEFRDGTADKSDALCEFALEALINRNIP